MPGVQDALTACIAEKTGFEVITCGGYSSTAALLGQPDTSQLTMIEMAEHYARICDSIDIPVFGDGDDVDLASAVGAHAHAADPQEGW